MNKYEIVKFVDDEVKLDVNISPLEKTIWINIEQISVLLERDRSVISKHIKNIFLEGELLEESVCAFLHILKMMGRYIMLNIIIWIYRR